MKAKIFRSINFYTIQKRALYAIAAIAMLSGSIAPAISASSSYSTYSISSSYRTPQQATVAGNDLWYVETTPTNPSIAVHIGRMTTSGATSDYDISALSSQPNFRLGSITRGPDGNIWFTGRILNAIYSGTLNIDNGTVTLYSSGVSAYASSLPIISGPDGNIWYYAKNAGNKYELLRVDPATGTTTSMFTSDTYSDYSGLSSGADGRLWILDSYYNRLLAFNTPTGTWDDTYNIPASVGTYPSGIIQGPDGHLWFRSNGGKIVKATTNGQFTEFTVPTNTYPYSLTSGADGAIWFTQSNGVDKIGRISQSGRITQYDMPTGLIGASSLVSGPDSALWLTTSSNNGTLVRLSVTPDFSVHSITSTNRTPVSVTAAGGDVWYLETTSTGTGNLTHIGRMTTSGATTDYDIPSLSGQPNLRLGAITTGPDGNIWFTGRISNAIYSGVLNITNGTATLYSSGASAYSTSMPIVTGPDGNLWYFIKNANNRHQLFRVSPSTGITTSTYTSDTYASYSSLSSGPDGRLWILDTYYKRLLAFTAPGGSWNGTYNLPSAISYAKGLITGPDGNIWFTTYDKIYKTTTSGVFTAYPLSSGTSAFSLTPGGDGAVWFIDTGSTKRIGRITDTGVVTNYTVPTAITNLSSLVLGADEAIWFSSSSNNGTIGRLGY